MKRLRIDLSMRYNARNGQELPSKAIAWSVGSTSRNLTQPTGIDGGLSWRGFYHARPELTRPGGVIPSGRFAFFVLDNG